MDGGDGLVCPLGQSKLGVVAHPEKSDGEIVALLYRESTEPVFGYEVFVTDGYARVSQAGPEGFVVG